LTRRFAPVALRQGIGVVNVLPVQFANSVGCESGPGVNRRGTRFMSNHAHRQIQLLLFPVVAVFGDRARTCPTSFFGSIRPTN
jgi:hypothetical protein